MELVKLIYLYTNDFPKSETYGILSQIRRAAISIPSNIAEGSSRNSDKELCRFLDISIGSCFELETQLILSKELNYFDKDRFNELDSKISELQKMLFGFKQKISSDNKISLGS